MWILYALCFFSWFGTVYFGIRIFILNIRIKDNSSAFLSGIFLTVCTTYTSIQFYEIDHNYENIAGTTVGLGEPLRGYKTIEYTYIYNGKKYYDRFRQDTFKVIYPNGKYQVRIAKRFPSFSRIDFNKPIE